MVRRPDPNQMDRMTDQELIIAYLAGDELVAPGVLVKRYEQRLQNFVYKMIGDSARAEDLIQETFFRAFRFLPRYEETRAKFSTWLYTIAGNLARNELRDRGRRHETHSLDFTTNADDSTLLNKIEDRDPQPDQIFEWAEGQEILTETINDLNPIYRDVLTRVGIAGGSYQEVAKATGIELGTLKSRLSRARRILRAENKERNPWVDSVLSTPKTGPTKN